MEKLNFLTAGVPLVAQKYENACETLRELNLDGMEFEFVHGVKINDDNFNLMKDCKKELVYTAHSPYYINLNAKEAEKVEKSIERILETAKITKKLGGYSIVYHAGFYLNQDKAQVQAQIVKCHEILSKTLLDEENKIWLRPETTGKNTQWGDLEEIVQLSKKFENVLPCIDFSHLHARSNGKFNTYDEFSRIFEYIGENLGDIALDNFHAHVAGIEYSEKGERHHLILENSDMNYKDLLKAFKRFGIKGVVVCESPNIETDCKLLKEFYLSI